MAGEWKKQNKGRKHRLDMEWRDSRHTAEAGRERPIKMSSFGTNAPRGFLSVLWRTKLPSCDAVFVQLKLIIRCICDDIKEHGDLMTSVPKERDGY